MRYVAADEAHRLLDYPSLVEALRELFRRGCDRVERFGLSQPLGDGRQNEWLLLPAWQFGRHQGIKLVGLYPDNQSKGMATVQGLYVLFDATNGLPVLAVDGAAITVRKTAANSALGATYLAREESHTLLMLGAGAMALPLIEAHCAVRPIRRVLIWNRTKARAESVAAKLQLPGVSAAVVDDIASAMAQADIVSAATMSLTPLIEGRWLRPGHHIDLVGGYREEMREADDEAVRRSRIFVDARFTAATYAGDICQPLASGIIADSDITDTFELARGEKPGRHSDSEITLFKSGGGGHEDLGTAQHLLAKLEAAGTLVRA